MSELFGTDGIRGRVFSGAINPFDFFTIGFALGCVLSEKASKKVSLNTILIARDTRTSCVMLSSALKAGIMSAGVDVLDCDIVPVSVLSFLVNINSVIGGAMISASHNPFYDNGVKLFNSFGDKISDSEQDKIVSLIKSIKHQPSYVDVAQLGTERSLSTGILQYATFVFSNIARQGSLSGMKIVIDCANGATVQTAKSIFRLLGADVRFLSASPDGSNINHMCGAVHPEKMSSNILEFGADIGFAFDGDGDRVVVADELGVVVDGDHLLGFCAKNLLSSGKLENKKIVATISSNHGLDLFLKNLEIEMIRSGIGDRLVCEKMKQSGAIFGGEDSGHIVFSEFSRTGDGIIAAIITALAVYNSGTSTSSIIRPFRLINSLRGDVICKTEVDDKIVPQLGEISNTFTCKVQKYGGKILIRKSGTEPKIRFLVELDDEIVASDIFREIKSSIEAICG